MTVSSPLAAGKFRIGPGRQPDDNGIDFFVQVEGKTFHEAMRIITDGHDYDLSEQELRKERGNAPEILR